jgi:hypothetical protein
MHLKICNSRLHNFIHLQLCSTVAESLVMNAERGEEGGVRTKALETLCDACPYTAASVRSKAAFASRLPSLIINLTLIHHQDDLVC